MPKYEESGVSLILDIDDYRRNIQEAISLAGELESTLGGLSDFSVNVGVEFDAGDVEEEISGLSTDATVTINTQLEDDGAINELESLDNETIDTTVKPDVEQTPNLLELEKLDDEPIQAEIDTVEGGEKIGGKSLLTKIHELGINPTQIVMNIAGTLLDGLKAIDDFTVQPLLDLDSAVARVNAQTANAIPNAHELISGIFYDDLGDSINQVANLVIQAQQIGAPIDEATRAALTFTHTFTDQDPSQVLNTMNQLVITGLVPNFTAASDLLVTGFQEGDNRAGDLLSTLTENAGAISDLGLTGSQALSLVKTGLDGGAASASDVLNTLIKIKSNVIGAAGNQTSDVTQLLANLGIPNPVDSGGTWSADFFTSVRDAIANAPVDDATKQQMFSTLVGGKIGAKEYGAFLNIDAADPAFNSLTGKAEAAATAMDDSLSGAVDDFKKAAQEAATNFLSSDAIDLPGKIEALKGGLQDALDTLAEGGDLGQALTVALKPIGFDDEFQSLESALGNFIIGILQAVASIQDLMGQTKAAEGTRNTIANMAQSQLAFDLTVDPDSVATSIETGFSRGLTAPQVQSAIGTAVTDLVNQGATGQAQALLDSVKSGSVTFTNVKDAFGNQFDDIKLPITPDMTEEDIQKMKDDWAAKLTAAGGSFTVDVIPGIPQDKLDAMQKLIDTTLGMNQGKTPTTGATPIATTTSGASPTGGLQILADVDDLTEAQTRQQAATDESTTAIRNQATGLDDLRTSADLATMPIDTFATSTEDAGNAAFLANVAQSDLAVSMADSVAQYNLLQGLFDSGKISAQEFADAVQALVDKLNSAPTGGGVGNANPDAPSGAKASGGIIPGGRTHLVGEKGAELVTANTGLAVLNNRTTQAIMAALSPMGMSMSSAQSGGNVYNVNNYNYVQSQAQADAMGYRTAAQIRGLN